jgi:hypothetical protein
MATSTRKRPGGLPPGLIVLALYVPWIIGCSVYAWHASSWLRERDYLPVQATVDKTELHEVHFQVVERCNRNRDPHEVRVTYVYEVGGERHVANRYDYEHQGDFFCSKEDALAQQKAYDEAGVVTAFYDPERPGMAVLARADGSFTVVFGVLLALSGIAITWYFFRQRRRFREADPWRDGGDLTEG